MNGLEIKINNKKISVGHMVYWKNGNTKWMIGVILWLSEKWSSRAKRNFGFKVAYDEEDVDSQLSEFCKLCITILA
jgi:hypothetical protein